MGTPRVDFLLAFKACQDGCVLYRPLSLAAGHLEPTSRRAAGFALLL